MSFPKNFHLKKGCSTNKSVESASVSVSPWGLVIKDIVYSHHMGSTLVHFPLIEQGLFFPNVTGCWTNIFILIELKSELHLHRQLSLLPQNWKMQAVRVDCTDNIIQPMNKSKVGLIVPATLKNYDL